MNPFEPPYNCIIIDDEAVDRLTTVSFATQYGFLHLVGIYASTEEALPALRDQPVEVMLLDIGLPGLDGLGFRRQMMEVPVCIFISTYSEHALKSFELATFDFIEKPLTADRFDLAMRRLQEYMELRKKAALFEVSLGGDIVYIKDGNSQVKIKIHDVVFLEAFRNYTKIVTINKSYYVISNLGTLLEEKAFESFLRIHRSYAVQKNFIRKITPKTIFINDFELPIGRSYKDVVKNFK